MDLPIKLVHSDVVTTDEAPMTYEPQNTVIVDDSSEFVQFLYNEKDLRTSHEVLAVMLAFVLVEMMQSSSTAIKPYSREAFQKVFTAKIEVEKFLYETYARPPCYL